MSAPPNHRLATGRLAGEAWARVQGLERGMTFLLWADDDGRLVALEGASFNEDISALDFDAVQIEFHPAPDGENGDFDDLPPSPELDQLRRRPRRA